MAQQQGSVARAQCAILIEGELRTDVLNEALQKVVDRHDILRTSFECLPGMEIPIQVISDAAAICMEIDSCGLSKNNWLEEILKERAALPFDFGRAPLLRCCLKVLSREKHVLLLDIPSICSDAYTLRNLFREIGQCYAWQLSGEDPVDEPLQYIQFSEWQNELLEGEDASNGAEFWQAQLRSSSRAIVLPLETERTEPTAKGSRQSALETIDLTIGPELIERIESAARRFNVSPASFLLACWQILIYKLTGDSEVSVRVLADGRKFEELRGALGLFAKRLPVVEQFRDRSPFSKALERVSKTLSEAQAWETYFTSDELPLSEETSSSYDYPIAFEYEKGEEKREWGGVSFSLVKHQSNIDRFKVCLSCLRLTDSLTLCLRFDGARFESGSVELLMSYFSRLLESAAGNPELPVGELEVLGPDLSAKVLVEWNKTHQSFGVFRSIQQLLEAQAEQSPDGTAVKFLHQSITFSELNASANRLAHRLISRGVGPESRVVLFLDRSIDMISSLWAVWKSGAAFVPLDIAQPRARLKLMLEQARPSLILTHRELVGLLPETEGTVIATVIELDEEVEAGQISQCSGENPEVAVEPNNLAYLIFTSGSTGVPKAAMIEHHSVTNLLYALDDAIYDHQRGSVVSLNGPLAFDGSIKQVIQLATGHTLVIVPEQIRADGEGLIEFIEGQELELLETTPSQLNLMLEAGLLEGEGFTPKKILVGGEAIDQRMWGLINQATRVKFYNVYGPTECTVDATAVEVSRHPNTPVIGKPLANVRLYVLDQGLRPVPIGVPGVLFIAGAGVGRGYFGRPDLTAEKFLPDPFGDKGARMYSTSDIVKYHPDGALEYLGRADRQVKVRGNRVELGEIEAALLRVPEIKQAVVQLKVEASQTRVIAYVVSAEHKTDADKDEYVLDNGMSIAHQNREETEALYEEIFRK
ncbi:MAG: amino acid adenylation domain-containing protein, partial [Blastocatellia bacterium]